MCNAVPNEYKRSRLASGGQQSVQIGDRIPRRGRLWHGVTPARLLTDRRSGRSLAQTRVNLTTSTIPMARPGTSNSFISLAM